MPLLDNGFVFRGRFSQTGKGPSVNQANPFFKVGDRGSAETGSVRRTSGQGEEHVAPGETKTKEAGEPASTLQLGEAHPSSEQIGGRRKMSVEGKGRDWENPNSSLASVGSHFWRFALSSLNPRLFIYLHSKYGSCIHTDHAFLMAMQL